MRFLVILIFISSSAFAQKSLDNFVYFGNNSNNFIVFDKQKNTFLKVNLRPNENDSIADILIDTFKLYKKIPPLYRALDDNKETIFVRGDSLLEFTSHENILTYKAINGFLKKKENNRRKIARRMNSFNHFYSENYHKSYYWTKLL